MRGRPNDPAKAKAKARAHAKHARFCDCGKVVHGNGGKTAHAAMHERRRDGHRYINSDDWMARFAKEPTVVVPVVPGELRFGEPRIEDAAAHRPPPGREHG